MDLIFTELDGPETLCIEKHLVFLDPLSISLGISRYSSKLSFGSDFRPYILSTSDIQSIDIEISTSLFSFDLLKVSDNLVNDWLKTLQTF